MHVCIYAYIEITAWLVSAYDFYARVVKDYIYVYMYICICVYVYICIYVYVYMCIYAYMYICIYVYMYICIYRDYGMVGKCVRFLCTSCDINRT